MLKAKIQNQSETFNDGIISILKAEDGVILSDKYSPIRYGEKTVGVSRFFKAEVSGSEISRMISVPFNYFVRQNDLIELTDFHTGEKEIYEIKLLQIKDTAPKSLYLTLMKGGIEYVDGRKT